MFLFHFDAREKVLVAQRPQIHENFMLAECKMTRRWQRDEDMIGMNRSWTGMALLLLSAADYWGATEILTRHPAHPIDLMSGIALVLVFTSVLLLMSGIGELINWIDNLLRR